MVKTINNDDEICPECGLLWEDCRCFDDEQDNDEDE